MPLVDEFSRSQPPCSPDHSAPAVVAAARRTRTATLWRWLVGRLRTLANVFGPSPVDWTVWRGE
jgi:hypothetical protein